MLWIRLDMPCRPWLNLFVEIEKEKNKNASLTSYIVHGVKIYLSGFSKLAPPTFKGVDNFEDP